MKETDIAIIGGGPAGLQAALVLSRLRKKIVVYDSPSPPRNGASHGVHNVLGLDGMLPGEIRKQAWAQIDVYGQAILRQDPVTNVIPGNDGGFIITSLQHGQLKANLVILALGFVDKYPAIDGFLEAWADTIIQCPFCDGYENRDRTWGLVANSEMEATHYPKIVKNWTPSAKLIINQPDIELEEEKMLSLGIPVYRGTIKTIAQREGKVQSVTLDTGERVDVGTLWWVPAREKTALEKSIIEAFDLELDEMGLIKTDADMQTSVKGLYAAGDIAHGPPSAMGAMTSGNTAAGAIVRTWYM